MLKKFVSKMLYFVFVLSVAFLFRKFVIISLDLNLDKFLDFFVFFGSGVMGTYLADGIIKIYDMIYHMFSIPLGPGDSNMTGQSSYGNSNSFSYNTTGITSSNTGNNGNSTNGTTGNNTSSNTNNNQGTNSSSSSDTD
jgi:hypothetical protein